MAPQGSGPGLLGRLQTLGFAKGVRGRSGPWLWIWGALWLFGKLRARAGTEVLLSEKLEPGQRIVISNNRIAVDGSSLPVRRGRGGRIKPIRTPRPTRAERRAARRSAR